MMYKLANVKISVKTTPLVLNIVSEIAKSKNIVSKQFPNFVVLKATYTYIIFKTNKQGENHINITKIPTTSHIESAVDFIKHLLNCRIKSVSIDNIIATSNILCEKKPNLIQVIESNSFENIKYNNEKFPGIFIKFNSGTVILFSSGALVILGCKTEASIECLIQKILANICNK